MATFTTPASLPGSSLNAADLAALARSGIPPELAEAAMLRRVDNFEGAEAVGRKANGATDYAGILFPYYWPGDNYRREVRLRRDRPDLEQQPDGSIKERNKYLSPPGRGNMLYFAPDTPPYLLDEISVPVLLTEGEKKTLSLWHLGWHSENETMQDPRWLPGGLGGVWNFRGVIGKAEGENGERQDVHGIIGDLKRIRFKGRKVTIIFDVNVRTNPSVSIARWRLTEWLNEQGAQVFWFHWPHNIPANINGIDDLSGAWGPDKTIEAIEKYTAKAPARLDDAPREFAALDEDRYSLSVPSLGVVFEVDHLKREHGDLTGTLTVKCELPGASTYKGILTSAQFNFLTTRTRTEWANRLTRKAKTGDTVDWDRLLEELCLEIGEAERRGQPLQDLRDFPDIAPEQTMLRIAGLDLLRDHPTILFGDGGSMKSYLGLWIAGLIAQQGLRVALFDWELRGEDHKARLKRLFGPQMPSVKYDRCERPLVQEAERLRRQVRDLGIHYVVYDSCGMACDGPPESAEVAMRYFRAVRQIGGGSKHITHVSKAENADKYPFGSVYWHNQARATWFIKRVEQIGANNEIKICLYNRKANLAGLNSKPLAFRVTFAPDGTRFRPDNPSDTPEFAEGMSLKWRMYELVKREPASVEVIAQTLGARLGTIQKYSHDAGKFTLLDGGKVALKSAG